MEKNSTEKISKRFSFFVQNPQIIYTIFLLIVIPLAFLFSGQNFLKTTTSNQEELERRRIGLIQDVFVEFAAGSMDRPDFLQERIESIAVQNDDMMDFKILSRVKEREKYSIIASLNHDEIGKEDDDSDRIFYYNMAVTIGSAIFPTQEQDGRHWKAARPIIDSSSNVVGIMYFDISMAYIDELASKNVQRAYWVLGGIVLLIAALLIRQAKVIDYAVLYRRLKEVDQMKDDFVSMAAHELRTPLTIIRGYSEMLSESKRLTETDRQMTANIEASANHLNQMVGDILDVSRLQQGRLSFNLADVQPESIIAEVTSSLEYTAQQKGLTLGYQKKDTGIITVDRDRLKQALINIVGNSVKYTPKGGVTVTSYVEGERYMIRVSDTGIGISAEDQKKLFERFYRVKSKETEEIRGTGLGLWITKQIIDQMKGLISVESIRGKGTDFIVSFPIKKEGVK